MKVAIAGGSGFIGQPLVEQLLRAGHEVAVLTRNPKKVAAGRPLQWDGATQGAWSAEVASSDAVVNLAGEDIGQRWTTERKRRLVDSRVTPMRALIEALRSAPGHPRVFVSASGVGYYGLRGDEVLDESGSQGGGFLAELAEVWEREARRAEPFARTVILRCGVVLGGGGGALSRMLLPFKLGLGGRIGGGRQWLSWIALHDVVRMYAWVMTFESARGVYNATSPNPVRNREFTAALGRALRRPTLFPIPGLALRMVYGQMAEETLLNGQRVVPARALGEGFTFDLAAIDSALQRAVRRS